LTSTEASASPSIRAKVSTGYARLDDALQGGFLAGSMVVLSAPVSDEVPTLLRRFLEADPSSLLVSRSLSSAEPILGNEPDGLKCLVCSDKPVPPAQNTLPGKGIENLTELSLTITETINSLQPSRLVVQFLSDVLLRHKALQTRKWLSELLDKFRARDITTLVLLNPFMHSSEEVQAIVDLFNGNIELTEKQVEGQVRKALAIKWMHGVEVAEKEFPLVDLTAELETSQQQVTVTVAPLKEPRWLAPLISRTEELSRLKTAFDNALANRGSVVALRGEAGVGKTRLMQELAVYVQSKNALVLSGSASEDGLAYASWVEIERQYVGQVPGELLRRMLGPNAAELVKLVPDIAAKLGTIPPSKSIGEQQDKLRFYEAVTQFFIAICKDKPLLLLFDDMQYADQPSLDLLEYFVRSTNNLRVLTVCSLPAEQEVETNSPLEQTMMKFNKQRILETITMKGLNLEGTTKLTKDIFGEQAVSQEFAELIFERTGGNPFFVEEVLRALVENGTIFRTRNGWDRKPTQELTVPRSVKTALRARLTKLDPEALSILQWAAVAGSEFDFELLLNVSQSNEDTLVQKIEVFISQALLAEIPHEKSKLRFADNRIRELLLDDLIQIKRTRYHLKVAEAMEKMWTENLESHADIIATHFSEAGDVKRSIKYSIMAGERNRTIHAYNQAVRNFKQALDLMALEKNSGQQKAVVLEKLGEVNHYAGKTSDSIDSYQSALEIFESLHDTKACARVCASLAETLYEGRGISSAAQVPEILIKGLKYIENESESFEAASIYATLADYYSLLDRYDEANSWIDKAVAVGERTGNFAATVSTLFCRSTFLADSGNLDEGLPTMEHALELALEHGQNAVAGFILMNLSGYTLQRNLEGARAYAARLVEHGRRVGDVMAEARGLALLWLNDWIRGDWEAAGKELKDASDIQDRVELHHTFLLMGWRSRFSLSKGDLDSAEKYANLALAKQESKITNVVINNLPAALLRLEQGREGDAMAHLQTCVEAFRKSEFTTLPLLHVETLMHLSVFHAGHKRFDEATSAVEWARRLATQLKSDAGLAMALQAEAGLLSVTGDGKGAEAAYLECLALWERAGWSYYHAKALVAYSEATAQSNPEESKKRLQQAAAVFKKLGAKRDFERARSNMST